LLLLYVREEEKQRGIQDSWRSLLLSMLGLTASLIKYSFKDIPRGRELRFEGHGKLGHDFPLAPV